MALLRLKETDEKTKKIIFGYSRQQQNKLELNIPKMIQYLFLAYYWIQEKFTKYGKCMKVDASCKKVTRDTTAYSKYNTAYGNNVIDINDTSISM